MCCANPSEGADPCLGSTPGMNGMGNVAVEQESSEALVEQAAERERVRTSAVRADRAPGGRNPRTEAERALWLWKGLVRGRWGLSDWFDHDGRRYLLIRTDGKGGGRATGLTIREIEVTMSAALGESSKATGYRLGVSPSRVSALLKSAMKKLGVKTKAQLVVMVRAFDYPRTDG